MAFTPERLARIARRLETALSIIKATTFPPDISILAPEERSTLHERLLSSRDSLVAALTNLQSAPTVSDIAQAQLEAAMGHAGAAFGNLGEISTLVQLLRSPPGGLNLTAAQISGIETRILALRDAALAELALIV